MGLNMKKTVNKIKLNDKFRYLVRIEDVECEIDTEEYKLRQFLFLQSLVNTPSLLNCGYKTFEKMTVYYDGTKWVADLEALTEE